MVAKAETTAVEENSVTEAPGQAESSTDAEPIPESEPNPAPSAVAVDEATSATSDEKVQSTAVSTSGFSFGGCTDLRDHQESTSEPAAESKA